MLAARRGSQTPRVANYPTYLYSDADEVIDLYEQAVGRPLDPWQKFVLRHGLGRLSPEQWAALKVACWVARQNGKGDIILALELAWLFLPGFQAKFVTHSAHQYTTAQEAFLRIKDVIDGSDDLTRRVRAIREANGEQGVITTTGQRLRFMARTRSGARGLSAPRVILDEAQELQTLMMASVLPTISAQPDPQVWLFGTPPDDPTAWVYDLKADGEAGVEDLAWFDWGRDIDLTTPEGKARVKDVLEAYAANPAMGPPELGGRITERIVLSEQRPSGLGETYPYERLGVWRPRATGGAGVIPDQLWRDLADSESERPTDVAFWAEVNMQRTYGAIVAVGPRSDGKMVISVVDYRAGVKWIAPRAAELKAEWDPVAIGFDPKGPAGTLVLDFKKAGFELPVDPDGDEPETPAEQERGIELPENPAEPQRGDLIIPSAQDVAAAYGQFVDLVNEHGIVHLDETPLNQAVGGADTRALAGGTAWERKSKVDISTLNGATGALWAYLTRAPLVVVDSEPGVYFV